VFSLSSRTVAVSRFSARQIASRTPSAEPKIRIVPTGVETDFFQPPPDRGEAKRALGVDPSVPLIIGVGRLAGVKQFDRLITAFAAAQAQGLHARLVIAGDGPERARLQRLIDTFGLQRDITLAGYCDRPRLRAFMQAADLQVCSSAFENLSLAILEGMACGTPVLGTPGGGTPELLAQIDPSLVLADDQPATLSDGLCQWMADVSRLEQLGAKARTIAVERYDWERVVDGLEGVCAEVSAA
jgi:glycosyltransferase involved in cell wall biosynthesis